jgi:hypothetical protein
LPKHGIYPTYFAEFAFSFGADQSAIYDTQRYTGQGPQAGYGMYYRRFDVDISRLDPRYHLHFDLYNVSLKKGGDIDVSSHAPFSHSADSRPATSVPEPHSITLLGVGSLAIVAVFRLRRRE